MKQRADVAHMVIDERIAPEALELFAVKRVDYEGTFLELGALGQVSDMQRKLGKLVNAVIRGKQLTGEQPKEIAQDLIGHALLLIYCLEERL